MSGYRLGMDWAGTHLALYDPQVNDTLWTGPLWRLPIFANLLLLDTHLLPGTKLLLLSGYEITLCTTWIGTCSVLRLLGLSSSFGGPAVRFPLGVVRALYYSYCFNVALRCTYPTHTWHQYVSTGGRPTIYASPSGWTLRSVPEREQLGVMIRGKW